MVGKRLARLFGLLALLLALAPSAPASAGSPFIEWTRQFGTSGTDSVRAVAVDAAGNIYVAGDTTGSLPGQTSAGNQDGFIRQYHRDGSEGWTRQFGTGGGDSVAGIAIDASGMIYLAGSTGFALPGQANAGAQDTFVRQYHPDGSLGWTRQFGTSTSDEAAGIALDAAGNIYVAGNTSGTFPGQASVGSPSSFVRQYHADGSEGWTRQYASSGGSQTSGVASDAAGNVFVVGITYGGAFPDQPNVGYYDAFVRQYHHDGSEGWTRQFGSVDGDGATSVALDTAGNVYVAGGTSGTLPGQTSAGYSDAFVRQYHADGVEGWTRQFGTPEGDWAFGVGVDAAGNVYASGQLFGVAELLRTDHATAWTYPLGTLDTVSVGRLALDPAGHVYVIGTTSGSLPGQVSSGDGDSFLVKLHPVDTPSLNPATPISPFPSNPERSYFAATGHSLAYGFQAYWNQNGGLPVFGYPLTEEFTEQGFTVQYLERQRFEYHPEERGTPYEVELGLLGSEAAARAGLTYTQPFQPLPPTIPSDANCTFFPETRHHLCFGFRAYWQSHGLDLGAPGTSYRESLALFGYPISEEFTDPASGLTVQYFERAVFEYHPDNPAPYTILLRRLGADELQARGWLP